MIMLDSKKKKSNSEDSENSRAITVKAVKTLEQYLKFAQNQRLFQQKNFIYFV